MLFIALRRFQFYLMVFAFTLAPTFLWAQSEADKSFAQEAFKKGQIQYNLGRFENALEHFSKAYEIMPHGAFLYNIGQCHRHLENHDKAIFFFEGYLRNLPNAPNRTDVEDLIAEHQAKLTLSKTRRPTKKNRQQTSKNKKKKPKIALPPSNTAAAESADTPQAPQAPEISSPSQDSWVVWALIGGVALLGTAIVIAAVASRASEEADTGSGSNTGTGSGAGSGSDPSLGTIDIQ